MADGKTEKPKRVSKRKLKGAAPSQQPNGADNAYREQLRQDLLPVALRIIEKEGLAALQARRVAAEAKCSVGSVYNVFGDLDGLIISANVASVHLLGLDLIKSFDRSQGQPVGARLLDLATSYKAFALKNINRWRAIFEHRLSDGRDVPAEYRADQARLLGLIEKIIADEVTDDETRLYAGRALFSGVHGIIALGVDHKLATYDPVALQKEIEFIVDAVARGLGGGRK